jgi:hypothetical protein
MRPDASQQRNQRQEVEARLNRGIWLAGLIAIVPMCGHAQTQGFEGTVSMTMHASGETIPVDYALKGHKARVDLHLSSRTSTVLIDLDAHTQTILIPELKAYAVHNGDNPSAVSAATPPRVTNLGTTETIAGHTCEDYKLETDKYDGTACMTREFGDNPLTDTINGPLGRALKGDETLKKAGMPLKLALTFKEGEKQGDKATMEVTKVAPGPVEEAQFEIPEGWHKLSGLPGLP